MDFLFNSIAKLEAGLGNPDSNNGIFAYSTILSMDENEDFPQQFIDYLYQNGWYDFFIPKEYGGKLKDFSELMSIQRALSRRDLTTAIAFGKSYLGSVAIWVGGDNNQKLLVANAIKDKKLIALGLTEREHGSDLGATRTYVKTQKDGSFFIFGEKWLINNATKCRYMVVLANSDQGGRGLNLFLFNKDLADVKSYSHLHKIKTLGIRGADISGIKFNKAELKNGSLIGVTNGGLSLILRSLQITRVLCCGLSLGAADACLRTTIDFCKNRILYNSAIVNLPDVKRKLTKAFAYLLISECNSLFAARALHVIPGQMSIISSFVKYFVPTLIEKQ